MFRQGSVCNNNYSQMKALVRKWQKQVCKLMISNHFNLEERAFDQFWYLLIQSTISSASSLKSLFHSEKCIANQRGFQVWRVIWRFWVRTREGMPKHSYFIQSQILQPYSQVSVAHANFCIKAKDGEFDYALRHLFFK